MIGSAERVWTVDRRSAVIRVPRLVCGCVLVGALVTDCVAGMLGSWGVVRGSVPVIAVPMIVLAAVWLAAGARLYADGSGLRYESARGSWSAPWRLIRRVVVRSAWEGSQPGGFSAGVRLILDNGTERDIPDYFAVGRDELASVIEVMRLRAEGGANRAFAGERPPAS